MDRKLKIAGVVILIAAAVCAKCVLAAESKPEAKSHAKQEIPQAAVQAPVPGIPGTPAPVELKIEKLDLNAAIKEISQEDPKALGEIYRAVGDIYIRKQKPDKAINLLDTYLRQEGADQSLLLNLASLYIQRGAVKEAVEIYEKIVQLHPEDMMTVPILANLYHQQGDFNKEVALLESSAKANPKNPEKFMQLANSYRGQNNWAKAEEAFKKAIELQPQVWYYQQLAQLYLQQDKLDMGVAVLEEGIAKLPGNEVELSMTMSDMYLQKGQKNKAEKILKGLLEKVSDPLRKDGIQMRLHDMTRKVDASAAPVPAAAPEVSPEPAVVISTAVTGKRKSK